MLIMLTLVTPVQRERVFFFPSASMAMFSKYIYNTFQMSLVYEKCCYWKQELTFSAPALAQPHSLSEGNVHILIRRKPTSKMYCDVLCVM